MTAPVSLLPPMQGWTFPAPAVIGLSDDEQRLVNGLSSKLVVQVPTTLTRWAYYDGTQRMASLGISIPPQLAGVRTVLDWPRACVDPLVMRAAVDGFRLPDSTDVDTELGEMWDRNDMDGEFPLAILDSLVAGRGYGIVGAGDLPGDVPVVTAESALNMTAQWDARSKRITSAYQAYEDEGIYFSALYLPNKTIFMQRGDLSDNGWVITDVDEHNFGEPPVVRLVNRARSSDREGRSDITIAVMCETDIACRAMLGMDIAREVYSVPHLWIIGAKESSFQDEDGNSKSALSMAMTNVLALERDEEGQAPTIGQTHAFDPTVFTKMIDSGAQRMASYTGFPPSYFGQTTTANPSSADAIRVAENGLDRRAIQVQRQSTGAVRKIGQLMWRYANGGKTLPDELQRLSVDWVDARTPTPMATSQAVVQQIGAGAIPATSDVTLGALGWDALQRARLAQDRALDPAQQLIEELGGQIAGKDIISALRLLKATGQAVPQPDPTKVPGEALPAPVVPAVPKATP